MVGEQFLKMRDGDIILIKKNNFKNWYEKILAKGIQVFDGVYYHHAQMWFNGIWEANRRIECNPISTLTGHNIIVLRPNIELLSSEKDHIQFLLLKYQGQKYDYWGTLFHQVIYILSLRRLWIGRTGRKAKKKMYCTEFVTSVMNDVRGYFPEQHKIGPHKLLQMAPLYYHVAYEGVWE